jgi:hypothetical protein
MTGAISLARAFCIDDAVINAFSTAGAVGSPLQRGVGPHRADVAVLFARAGCPAWRCTTGSGTRAPMTAHGRWWRTRRAALGADCDSLRTRARIGATSPGWPWRFRASGGGCWNTRQAARCGRRRAKVRRRRASYPRLATGNGAHARRPSEGERKRLVGLPLSISGAGPKTAIRAFRRSSPGMFAMASAPNQDSSCSGGMGWHGCHAA